jgi:hypothetical protein
LGITVAEYVALEDVRKGLLSGRYHHGKYNPKKLNFRMVSTCENPKNVKAESTKAACGTVACIGGWVAFSMNKKSTVDVRDRYVSSRCGSSLYRLYYEYNGDPKPKQAARAIKNFLKGSADPWFN